MFRKPKWKDYICMALLANDDDSKPMGFRYSFVGYIVRSKKSRDELEQAFKEDISSMGMYDHRFIVAELNENTKEAALWFLDWWKGFFDEKDEEDRYHLGRIIWLQQDLKKWERKS